MTVMKKRLIHIFATTGLIAAVALGCAKQNIDTAKVRAALQSLAGDAKQNLEEGLTAIDQSNYVAAVKPLKKIAFTVKLDKDQRVILEDTIAKAEAKAAKQK
jgi:hypothetical protein